MKYQVVLTKRIQKDLAKIDDRYRDKIDIALLRLSACPQLGKKLEGDLNDQWSFRIGIYRIIYEINDFDLIVLIIKIGRRKGVYKK